MKNIFSHILGNTLISNSARTIKFLACTDNFSTHFVHVWQILLTLEQFFQKNMAANE